MSLSLSCRKVKNVASNYLVCRIFVTCANCICEACGGSFVTLIPQKRRFGDGGWGYRTRITVSIFNLYAC